MPDRSGNPSSNPSTNFPFLERNGFRALLFDWDGVLVDSGADYYRAYELALEPEGLKLARRQVMLREGRKTSEVIAALYADRGITLPQAKLDELVARRLGFYKQTARAIFFDGIWELVEELRAAHCKLGIVTGSSRIHDVLPLSAEREKLFDAVVTADDIERPNGSAAISSGVRADWRCAGEFSGRRECAAGNRGGASRGVPRGGDLHDTHATRFARSGLDRGESPRIRSAAADVSARGMRQSGSETVPRICALMSAPGGAA